MARFPRVSFTPDNDCYYSTRRALWNGRGRRRGNNRRAMEGRLGRVRRHAGSGTRRGRARPRRTARRSSHCRTVGSKRERISSMPASNPSEIDSTTEGRDGTEKGIYAVEGDTLKLCLSTQGGKRPTEFATKTGTDELLIVLRRVENQGDDKRTPPIAPMQTRRRNPAARGISAWDSPASSTTSRRRP